MSHLIELKDIYKIYHMGEETVHALDGINLTVDQGEFVAIRQVHGHEHYRLPGRSHVGNLPLGGH